ncbi:hypothetical protein [Burkholderia gladioli]|uniref:hypothetical protein n=1 Tax=Burkholderia gladioli TaxID=28095 RepID=UPI00139EE626|nr:hypothetical protein [Burkholderia gladioli]KAF1064922.1 hypothetical protein LvStA_03593 [Burkholderia gladioli]
MTREECLGRFLGAVREGRRGNFEPGKALIRSVRERFGDAAAERQRAELTRYVASEAKA